MKVRRVLIQNYRSIVDSGWVEIDESVTVIVGKNEQGKTTFLRGIHTFNQDESYSAGDLPNHLRPILEDKSKTEPIPIASLVFGIDEQDRKRLLGFVADVSNYVELKCVKYYKGNYKYYGVKKDASEHALSFTSPDLTNEKTAIKKSLDSLKTKLDAHGTRVPAFATNAEKVEQVLNGLATAELRDSTQVENALKTFSTSIKGLPSLDQAMLDDITTAVSELESTKTVIVGKFKEDRSQAFRDSLPRFVYHSTKGDQIPDEVRIDEFLKNPDGTSRGMANLCRAADLSLQKIAELASTKDTSERRTYEDYYESMIAGGLNEFWTQEKYKVNFEFAQQGVLSVSISDNTYPRRIAPSKRSEGFQWYLSFYATVQDDVGASKQSVLLLDNPGLELHLDGQRDIKRYLEQKVSYSSQVVYVTHSPAMIDAYNLKQVRTVQLHGDQAGTKVQNLVIKQPEDIDLLEPVRAAIGMSLVSSLILNEWNVLVEGAADKPIIEGIFFRHYQEHQKKILVNGSLAESADAFLARFFERTGLPYVVLVDADSAGRKLLEVLRSAGIPEEKMVRLNDVFTDKEGDFEIEDLLEPAFYHQAVSLAYPSQPVPMPTGNNRKRTNLYEEVYRQTYDIGFSKKRVAEQVKKLLSEYKDDDETKNRLGKLSTAIIKKLEGDTKTVEATAAAAPTSKRKG